MSTLLYNPDRKNRKQFIEEFVVRTEVFDALMKDIRTGRMKHPEQHYLLVGQRGAGKTTLLTRIRYAIEDDPQLKNWLIPVMFNEEQYHISELANVWENIAEYLQDYHDFAGICEEMDVLTGRQDFEHAAFDLLIKRLNASGKKLILFVDNIGDLLKKFDDLEVKRLREILQTIPQIRLIAGSPVVFESLLDYHQPMFEFFKIITLKGLSSEESQTLLRKLAKLNKKEKEIETIIRETPARIETLRVLSGGVPRTMALLFDVLSDNGHGNALLDLEKVLDAVTPLYKHRMDDLPTQQQKIVDIVAKNWDPISVKQLVSKTRLESKLISAQLRQLVQNQVVEIQETGKKNHLYLMSERFYNIWYLMRYGRKQDRQRVIWLVKFMEMWCDVGEIEERITNYIDKSTKGEMNEKVLEMYAEVYSFFEKVKPELKLKLKSAVPQHVRKHIEIAEDDIPEILERFYQKQDLDGFLNIASIDIPISYECKLKIAEVFNNEPLEAHSKLLVNLMSSVGTQNVNDILISLIQALGLKMLRHSIVLEEPKYVTEAFEGFINALGINPLIEWGRYEDNLIIRCVYNLVCGGYYSYAKSLVNLSNFAKRYENVGAAVDYFLSNNDNSALMKLAPEIRTEAWTMIEIMNVGKKKFGRHKAGRGA